MNELCTDHYASAEHLTPVLASDRKGHTHASPNMAISATVTETIESNALGPDLNSCS